MARKKISEWKAKTLVYQDLQIPYSGLSVDSSFDSSILDEDIGYVVKVDGGVKKRMKKGLVGLNRTSQEVKEDIQNFAKEGYKHFIIEPFVPHESSSEKYISIERIRDGLQILYSERGGIDVEETGEEIQKLVVPYFPEYSENSEDQVFMQSDDLKSSISDGLSIPSFMKLLNAFNKYHFSFLEINPLVVENGNFHLLDIAVEVDSAGKFFVHSAWDESDFRTGQIKEKIGEEKNVDVLSQKSQASFNLTVLDPNGSVFMLLSGGGASIVLADEVYNVGFGKMLANYGEYSGNPNAEEVYIYTKNILELLIKSSAEKKILIIGGGVANFTDVSITFKGIIKALDEKKDELERQQVKIFVRRGGPHQEEGLSMMEKFLKKNDLFGLVADQDTSLPKIVTRAIDALKGEVKHL
jgi:succinyl-CoA synthetase beta subunit